MELIDENYESNYYTNVPGVKENMVVTSKLVILVKRWTLRKRNQMEILELKSKMSEMKNLLINIIRR